MPKPIKQHAVNLVVPSNKSLHTTPVNVAKISDSNHLFRVGERVLVSWSASELERSAELTTEFILDLLAW